MASSHITVFVKPLFGDVLAVEVDPTLGLQGVAAKLSLEDSKNYPLGLTVVSFIDEEQKELTHESMLAVLVQEPIESIVRVDTFQWRGSTAYRLRIKADRTKSMRWMSSAPRGPRIETDLNIRRQSPQLFDICHYPEDRTFMIPDGGRHLSHLESVVGTRAKRSATVLKKPIIYRRDNVGLDEFDDDISRLPTEEERIDWSEFCLNEDAVRRISALIAQWISEQSF